MRLTCNSCGSRFVIDDQLVRGKLVRLLCKHCSNILEASLPSHPPAPLRLEPGGSPPRPPPGRRWYLALFGRVLGPMGLPELRVRVRRGEVLPDDLAWHSGLSGWQPVSLIEELCQELPRQQPAQGQPPPAPGGLHPQQLGSGPIPLLAPYAGAYPLAQPYAALPGAPYSLPAPYLTPEAGALRSGEQPLPSFSLTPALGTPQLPYAWPAAAAPGRYAAWPLWLGIIGGLMMLAATITLLLLHLDARSASRLSPPTAAVAPQHSTAAPHAAEQQPPQVVELPALEVLGARSAQPAERPANPPPARALVRPTRHAAQAPAGEVAELGQQIYTRYRASLEACDRLALERGEVRGTGLVARFLLTVDPAGQRRLELQGQGLSQGLVACYRASVAQWSLPLREEGLRVSFAHTH